MGGLLMEMTPEMEEKLEQVGKQLGKELLEELKDTVRRIESGETTTMSGVALTFIKGLSTGLVMMGVPPDMVQGSFNEAMKNAMKNVIEKRGMN